MENNDQLVKMQAAMEQMQKTISALAPVAQEVTVLKTQLAEKDKTLSELQSKVSQSSQEQALSALKTKYPDVPESVLKALPDASREAEAKALQDKFSQVKTTPVKTGPNAWDNAGIGPTLEAEDAVALAERTKRRDEAVKKGDPLSVMREKARDTVEFLRKHYPSAV